MVAFIPSKSLMMKQLRSCCVGLVRVLVLLLALGPIATQGHIRGAPALYKPVQRITCLEGGNSLKGMKSLMYQSVPELVKVSIIDVLKNPLEAVSLKQARITVLDPLVAVLQSLWGNWNKSTPDPSSNLAGWSSTQGKPCNSMFDDRSLVDNWRGVECLPLLNETASEAVDIRIIGITLIDASIVGTLPPEIGNITTLSTLQLNGNPGLTGPIPTEIQMCWLNYLDLHDNGFNGTIPELSILWNLLKLDLSGNQFSGPYPLSQISSMNGLQELSLADNLFEGPVPDGAIMNKTQLDKLDLSRNMFFGPLPNLTMNDKLQFVDLSDNKFNGSLPDLTMTPTIKILNLSTNGLTGTINLSSIFNSSCATLLSVMDLSNNQLTGDLPLWSSLELGSLEELYLDRNNITGTLNVTHLSQLHGLQHNATNSTKKLGLLSLTNNGITDVVYEQSHIMDTSTIYKLQGNPFCKGRISNDATRCYCQQICFDSQASDRNTILVATLATGGSLLVLLVVVVATILYRYKRYNHYLLMQFQQKFEEFDVKPTIYSYNELRTATRDFHVEMKLGEGAYGAVYKGILSNGNVVAVKQLFVKTSQGIDEFLNEVVLITGMKHRNLVNLKGCCLREHQRLLVYELVDNYDIEKVLLAGGKQKVAVGWPVRLNILKGVARGLHYLHALAQPRIIHRDIKASNILLDKSFEPKIADFGLALLFPDEQSHIMTVNIAGTKGYLAPEYAVLGQLSDKVDVYSFGVLCLEVVSGRKNINVNMPPEHMYLAHMAWVLHEQGKLMDLIDPSLGLQNDDLLEAQRVINIALMCLQVSGENRPNMDRVLTMLGGETISEVIAPVSAGDTKALYRRRISTNNKAESTLIEGYSYNINSSGPMSPNLLTHPVGHMADGTATLELSALTPR